MSAVGNQLFVCCGDGNVYEYDPTLMFVRYHYASKYLNQYSAASLDTQGNTYCADTRNSCIQVFSNKDVYLHCFDRDGSGAIVLCQPNYVRVHDKYVYITNSRDPHSLFLFTTDGEHLCTYCLPYSFLGVDADGYIYERYGNMVYRY